MVSPSHSRPNADSWGNLKQMFYGLTSCETSATLRAGGMLVSPSQTVEDRVAAHYAALTGQMRKAADYVLTHPVDLASRSLRSLAAASDVSPATYSRLARALEFDSFSAMQDLARSAMEAHMPSFADRADALRQPEPSGRTILDRQSAACIANIYAFAQKTDESRLRAAAVALRQANRVVLFGALGSTGIVEYLAYLAHYFAPNWSIAGRMGASVGASLSELSQQDALLIVTKTPYAARAVKAAKLALSIGAEVIIITDHHQCPALAHATHTFIVPSESPQFFSSYVATLVLIETLIAMILASSEADTTASIRKVEDTNRALGEFWANEK